MLKTHELKTTIANYEIVSFFYIREKSGKTGIFWNFLYGGIENKLDITIK